MTKLLGDSSGDTKIAVSNSLRKILYEFVILFSIVHEQVALHSWSIFASFNQLAKTKTGQVNETT